MIPLKESQAQFQSQNPQRDLSPATFNPPPPPAQPGHRVIAAWCLAAILIAVWGAEQAVHFHQLGPTYTPDGAAYVECARSIIQGRGFQYRVYAGADDIFWEPATLWPPGFPIMIAGLALAGIPVQHAGIVIQILSSIIALAAILFIGLDLLPRSVALIASFGVALMPGYLQSAGSCLSDTPYLAVTALAVLCLIKGIRRLPEANNTMLLVGLAGLLSGFAWCTRYAAVSLTASTLVFLLLHMAWLPKRAVARLVGSWCAGFLIGAGPLTWRNLVVFGTVVPYGMPPSTITLGENARTAIAVLARDMTTWTAAADKIRCVPPDLVLTSLAVLLVAAGISAFAVCSSARGRRALTDVLNRHSIWVFLLGYLCATVTLVVLARTKYQWGEFIDSRYFVPVYWIIWFILAAVGLTLTRLVRIAGPRRHLPVLALLLILVSSQWRDHRVFINKEVLLPQRMWNDTELFKFVRSSVGSKQIVFATNAPLLRIFSDVNARIIYSVETSKSFGPPPGLDNETDFRSAAESGLLWGFVIDDREAARKGRYGEWVQALALNPHSADWLEPVALDSRALILRAVGGD